MDADRAWEENHIRSFSSEALWSDFLEPDEDNFSVLLDRISWLQRRLTEKGWKRPALRAGGGPFSYSRKLQDSRLPEDSSTREFALEGALEAFEGTFRPHHPHSLFNIAPSPMIDSVALSAITLMNNPNAIWDLSSGKVNLIEQKVIRYLGDLACWTEAADGTFTSGGKATLLYAVKMGLNRCDSAAVEFGVRNKYLVISSTAVHFSLESVCNFLGLGTSSCVRVGLDGNGRFDLVQFKDVVTNAIDAGTLIPAVVLAGGPLIDTRADPVRQIRRVLLDVAREKGLGYVPLVHFDCVVTWPWLALNGAVVDEFECLTTRAKANVHELSDQLVEVAEADSFGVDFHKTGLTPYASSCFVTKHSESFRRLNYRPQDGLPEEDHYGQFCSFDRTLENSRSSTGIISAYYVLLRLGREGLQRHIIRWATISEDLRELISGSFSELGTIVNQTSLGLDVIVRFNFGMSKEAVERLESSSEDARAEYARLAMGFREWTISSKYCTDFPMPVLGYVPYYRRPPSPVGLPAFLFFPNSPYSTRAALSDVLSRTNEAVAEFLRQKDSIRLGSMDWEGRPLPPR